MNVKLISVIFLFSLFLILSASSVCAHDNSTDLICQNPDDCSVSDIGNNSDYYGPQHWNSGEWMLDETGKPVYVQSNNRFSGENFSVEYNLKNITDLRNNVSDVNRTQNISSPSQMNHLWEEFVKDPVAFMEKYNPKPKAPPATWDGNVQNSSCYGSNSKEFADFIKFVEKTRATPNVIESSDVNVFYSANNSYGVRIINPVGDSVGKGVNVTFIFNGKKYCAKTDDDGYASFSFTRQAGSYSVKAYVGNISSKNKITVKPLFKTHDITKKYKKSSKFTVKLVKMNGKSVNRKAIKITFKGKTHTIKTNSKGIATFTIPKNLKLGKYTIKTLYNGCLVKNSLKVKN